MKVGYSKSFLKDVQNLTDKSVSENLKDVLLNCKEATSLKEISDRKSVV